jgi:uncharacterized membrane protein
MSFVFVGIYWNNHHHLLHATTRVSGGVLWANLHLLFWLSLIPFATGWLGENQFAATPAAVYGIVLLAAAAAYFALQQSIIRAQGDASPTLARAVGRDLKGKLSPVLYALGIGLAFVDRWLSVAMYVIVALMWLIPDRRVERALASDPGNAQGQE